MDQLKTIKLEDGSLGILCPRCASEVQPVKNQLFSDYDCPDCQGTIDASTLRKYLRTVKRHEDNERE